MKIVTLEKQEVPHSPVQHFAFDVLIGLSRPLGEKYIPPVYFYDEEGTRLFQRITELDEYYLTRCEHAILETHGTEIASVLKGSFDLIELGVGDGRKSQVLIRHFLEAGLDFEYLPIDISKPALEDLGTALDGQFPDLSSHGLHCDNLDALQWLDENRLRRRFVLFLGSNMGNYGSEGARRWLHKLWCMLNDGDYLLLGLDRGPCAEKSIDQIEAAYRDSENVTEAFNRNMLERINRELSGNFDQANWRFFSGYNPQSGAVESWLISVRRHVVNIGCLKRSFTFAAGEGVHLEYSHKYSLEQVANMAEDTGFEVDRQFLDPKGWFIDSLWRVKKE